MQMACSVRCSLGTACGRRRCRRRRRRRPLGALPVATDPAFFFPMLQRGPCAVRHPRGSDHGVQHTGSRPRGASNLLHDGAHELPAAARATAPAAAAAAPRLCTPPVLPCSCGGQPHILHPLLPVHALPAQPVLLPLSPTLQLRPKAVTRELRVDGCALVMDFAAVDMRTLRAAVGTFCDLLGLATRTLEAFGPAATVAAVAAAAAAEGQPAAEGEAR